MLGRMGLPSRQVRVFVFLYRVPRGEIQQNPCATSGRPARHVLRTPARTNTNGDGATECTVLHDGASIDVIVPVERFFRLFVLGQCSRINSQDLCRVDLSE